MDNTPVFSIKDAFRFGWEMFKEKAGFLLALFAITIFLSFLPDLTDKLSSDRWLLFFVQVVSFVIGFVVDASLIAIMLRLYDGKEAKVSDIFSQYPIVFQFFITSVMYGVMVFFGLLLFIAPGVYFALKYPFAGYFIVDKRLPILESFRQSARITHGQKAQLFRFWAVMLGFHLLGLLALGVGILVTMPVSMLATAYVYRKISSPVTESEKEKEEQEENESEEKKMPLDDMEGDGVKAGDVEKEDETPLNPGKTEASS